MTSSDAVCRQAAEAVARLADLLNEDRLRDEIDAPIDDAARRYLRRQGPVHSAAELHAKAAEFVHHIYAEALSPRRQLSASQAHDEALHILEGYRGTHADGYDGALADALDPTQPGLDVVLVRLAEFIKEVHRDRHVRWVKARHVDPSGHRMKCAMFEHLRVRCGMFLPPHYRQGPPARYSDDVAGIVQAALAAGVRLADQSQ